MKCLNITFHYSSNYSNAYNDYSRDTVQEDIDRGILLFESENVDWFKKEMEK